MAANVERHEGPGILRNWEDLCWIPARGGGKTVLDQGGPIVTGLFSHYISI